MAVRPRRSPLVCLALPLILSFIFAEIDAMSTQITPQTSVCTSSLSLGHNNLGTLVQKAATTALAEDQLDLPGIVWLEHVNLVVGNKELARKFYIDVLGLTPDASKSFHVNLGQQQFHLAETGEPAQKLTGSMGLTFPDLQALRQRISQADDELKDGTLMKILQDDEENGCLVVQCPWGNRLHCYDLRHDDTVSAEEEYGQKMVRFHARGGVYGPHRMAVRGNPGIRYLEIACPSGTANAIAEFYKEMLGCKVLTPTDQQAVISVGPGVHLVFNERENLTTEDQSAMEGVHICVYYSDFQGLYNRLKSRGLIWTNPRFTHLDSCDTWEEARDSRTLRFKDLIDLKSGEKLIELEHETRPLMHGQYMKVPAYVPR